MAAKYIAIVQEPGQPFYAPSFAVVQKPEFVDKDGIRHNAVTIILEPDQLGVLTIPDNEHQQEILTKFTKALFPAYNKRRKVLAGPFDSRDDALKAQHELRPKTDAEQAAAHAETAKRVTSENNELKAKIAELEANLAKKK